MGYRGRLIWPQIVEMALQDTAATQAGPPTPGYDADFHEPVRIADSSPRGSHPARKETLVKLPAQVMIAEVGMLVPTPSGSLLQHNYQLTFHQRDLEAAGMLDATGRPKLNVGDRLNAIYHPKTGVLIQRFDPPHHGQYITRVQPQSYGLDGLDRNLLVVDVKSRDEGKQ